MVGINTIYSSSKMIDAARFTASLATIKNLPTVSSIPSALGLQDTLLYTPQPAHTRFQKNFSIASIGLGIGATAGIGFTLLRYLKLKPKPLPPNSTLAVAYGLMALGGAASVYVYDRKWQQAVNQFVSASPVIRNASLGFFCGAMGRSKKSLMIGTLIGLGTGLASSDYQKNGK